MVGPHMPNDQNRTCTHEYTLTALSLTCPSEAPGGDLATCSPLHFLSLGTFFRFPAVRLGPRADSCQRR